MWFYQLYTLSHSPDGKVVAVGYTLEDSNYDFAIARYNTDGSLDNSFSGDGKQTTDFDSDNNYATSVVIQSDGKIVVGGYIVKSARSYTRLVRYNADGSLDPTFANDGSQSYAINNTYGKGPVVALQNDGKIVMAGTM
ncbi:MAG: delta-60 repeat domain-containing protein [Segetibacter sp.]